MEAYIQNYLMCGECRELLMYGNADSDGHITTVKCANSDCGHFGIDYKVPVIELVEAYVKSIGQSFIPKDLSMAKWDFKNKEDNPLDWISKFYTVKNAD